MIRYIIIDSGRKIARNVMSMASSTTTEAEVASTDPSVVTADSPELLKTIQQTVRTNFKFIYIYIPYSCVLS